MSGKANFQRIDRDGRVTDVTRPLAKEVPVAVEINGLGYAVLMASPADLEDLACGFMCAERLVDAQADIIDIDVHPVETGVIVRVTLAARVSSRVHDRVRHRTSKSSCGLCGIDNLEQALRPLPKVMQRSRADHAAIFAALSAIDQLQVENRRTGAVHAAALCSADGSVKLIREDVGRHNALDKLIGAMSRETLPWADGFALVTSRCSFEMVEKAVLAGCPLLVAISAQRRHWRWIAPQLQAWRWSCWLGRMRC